MSMYRSGKALRRMLREYRKMVIENKPPERRSWLAGVLRRANGIRLQRWAVDPVPPLWQCRLELVFRKTARFPVPRIFLSPQVRKQISGQNVVPLLKAHFQGRGTGGHKADNGLCSGWPPRAVPIVTLHNCAGIPGAPAEGNLIIETSRDRTVTWVKFAAEPGGLNPPAPPALKNGQGEAGGTAGGR